jgi:hypothetical protein
MKWLLLICFAVVLVMPVQCIASSPAPVIFQVHGNLNEYVGFGASAVQLQDVDWTETSPTPQSVNSISWLFDPGASGSISGNTSLAFNGTILSEDIGSLHIRQEFSHTYTYPDYAFAVFNDSCYNSNYIQFSPWACQEAKYKFHAI